MLPSQSCGHCYCSWAKHLLSLYNCKILWTLCQLHILLTNQTDMIPNTWYFHKGHDPLDIRSDDIQHCCLLLHGHIDCACSIDHSNCMYAVSLLPAGEKLSKNMASISMYRIKTLVSRGVWQVISLVCCIFSCLQLVITRKMTTSSNSCSLCHILRSWVSLNKILISLYKIGEEIL